MGLIDTLLSVCLKCLCCFGTSYNSILCTKCKLLGGNVGFGAIFETFQWLSILSLFLWEFDIEKFIWDSVILHQDNMPQPTEWDFQDHGTNNTSYPSGIEILQNDHPHAMHSSDNATPPQTDGRVARLELFGLPPTCIGFCHYYKSHHSMLHHRKLKHRRSIWCGYNYVSRCRPNPPCFQNV